jgi:hypothetical protein
MADVFFSYKRTDQQRVESLVRILEREGFNVWWDSRINPGERFAKAIREELEAASCVIVAWSEASIDSIWVQDEATNAGQRGILVPISLDGVEAPLGFGGLQTLNLKGWSGDAQDPRIRPLIAAVHRLVGAKSKKATASSPQPPRGPFSVNEEVQPPEPPSDYVYSPPLSTWSVHKRPLPLDEFPSLFAMEGHTGSVGALVTLLWFVLAWRYVPGFAADGVDTAAWATGIIVVFIALAMLSSFLYGHFSRRIADLGARSAGDAALEKRLARRVRFWIAFLSGSYVLVCCFLIWLTSGVRSPFIPFYVMIFTLTIGKSRMPFPGLWFFGYFTLAILAACYAAENWSSPIDRKYWDQYQSNPLSIFVATLFLFFSLGVPTLSAQLVNQGELRREKKREALKAELRSSE